MAGRQIGEDNLDLETAAKRLGVSRHTLRAWSVYQHRVPYLRLGSRILFSPADILAFEQRSRVPARENTRR